MTNSEIEKAEKKLAQAKARLQGLKARASAKERKLDTRRKIILGGALLERAARGDELARRIIAEVTTTLPRKADQSAFDGWNISQNIEEVGE